MTFGAGNWKHILFEYSALHTTGVDWIKDALSDHRSNVPYELVIWLLLLLELFLLLINGLQAFAACLLYSGLSVHSRHIPADSRTTRTRFEHSVPEGKRTKYNLVSSIWIQLNFVTIFKLKTSSSLKGCFRIWSR